MESEEYPGEMFLMLSTNDFSRFDRHESNEMGCYGLVHDIDHSTDTLTFFSRSDDWSLFLDFQQERDCHKIR